MAIFEAADQPGGQIRLTAQSPRRAEMMQIIEWCVAQCEARGVDMRFNFWAEPDDVISEKPDFVVISTGGLPNTALFETTVKLELEPTSWDIIAGDVKPASSVLIYDEVGDHAGLQAAEIALNAASRVEIMTPDRTFAPDVMARNLTPYMRALQQENVTFTVTRRLTKLEKIGNRLEATIGTAGVVTLTCLRLLGH